MDVPCKYAVHTSAGLNILDSSPSFGEDTSGFVDNSESIKAFTFSKYGNKLGWISDGGNVCVASTKEWKRIGIKVHPRAQDITFSPTGNYVAVWETFVTKDGKPVPNMSIYNVSSGELIHEFVQQSQINWEPQWTLDENVFAMSSATEVCFYQNNDFNSVKQKKSSKRLKSFSLSPSKGKHYVLFFILGYQGAPSFIYLHRYPDVSDASAAVASKSFFKVESLEAFWDAQAASVLVMTTAAIDKSSNSYYGEQMLFYLDSHGDSARVSFKKPGNIRSIAWCPDGQHFFAIYGTPPARATMFNKNCESVAEFGEGARNIVMVNPVGNVVMIGGYGNISSRFEFWDVAKQKLLGKQECPDITKFEWSPCGQFLLTSTCSPRLRVNNGYKIWHYTAALQYEYSTPKGTELYNTAWVPCSEAAKSFTVSGKAPKGLEIQFKTASTQRYIPPSQRVAEPPQGATGSKKFLSQYDDPTYKEESKPKQKPKSELVPGIKSAGTGVQMTGDPEKDKKIKAIKKKLGAIAKLKADQTLGKKLDKEQMKKLNSEQQLIDELKALTV